MRDSVLIYRSFVDAIALLPEDEQLKAYKAIVEYGIYDKEPELDGVAGAVFMLAKPQIDANNRRYENGKRGGRSKKAEAKPNGNQTETKDKPNTNQAETESKPKEKVKVNVKDNNNPLLSPLKPQKPKNKAEELKKKQLALFDRLIVGRAVSHEMADALRDWVTYKAELIQPYKEAGMRALITQAVNHGAAHGGRAVIEVINNSMASGYKGITWDRIGNDKKNSKFNNATERDEDMIELEKKLLTS